MGSGRDEAKPGRLPCEFSGWAYLMMKKCLDMELKGRGWFPAPTRSASPFLLLFTLSVG